MGGSDGSTGRTSADTLDPALLARWNAEGRAADVLAATLPDGVPAGTATDDALREGEAAAQRLGRFADALALNDARRARLAAPDGDPLARARASLHAVGPLVELDRRDEAADRLDEAAPAIEERGDADDRASLHAHRSHLARVAGDRAAAVRHERGALRVRYEAGDAAAAVHHHNLASLLAEDDDEARRPLVLTHAAAAAVLALQTGSPLAADLIASLVRHRAAAGLAQAPLPADFAALCAGIEEDGGVSLRALFDALPRDNAADGDDALRQVLGQGATAADGLPSGTLAGVRASLRHAVVGLASARKAGASARDLGPSVEGLRRTAHAVAPELDAELDGWLGRLAEDPAAILAELGETDGPSGSGPGAG